MLKFVAAILLFVSAQALANDLECKKAYGARVSECAQDLNNLSDNMRAGVQRACVDDAKIAKESCLSGADQCLTTCQTTYDSTVLACQENEFFEMCGGNLSCKAFFRAECVSAAATALASCSLGCQ